MFEAEKNRLTPTHTISIEAGVAYIKHQPTTRSGSWKREPLTITCYKSDKILEKEALKQIKEKFPTSVGAFFFPYSWENATRIAPDPDLSDTCGCMLGLGGGIYMPDIYLDVVFGVAHPWDANRAHLHPEKGTWWPHLDTVKACSDRDDLDDTYLGKIQRQRQGFKDDVGYFIVKKLWDKARKHDGYQSIGENAGLSKDHDPSKANSCH